MTEKKLLQNIHLNRFFFYPKFCLDTTKISSGDFSDQLVFTVIFGQLPIHSEDKFKIVNNDDMTHKICKFIFEEMTFDITEARQEDTCSGRMLLD